MIVAGIAIAAAHEDKGRRSYYSRHVAWRDTKATAKVPYTGWYVFYSAGRGTTDDRRSGPFSSRQEARKWMDDEDATSRSAYIRYLKYRG